MRPNSCDHHVVFPPLSIRFQISVLLLMSALNSVVLGTAALALFQAHPKPFFFEAVLDRAWLAELLARVGRLRQ